MIRHRNLKMKKKRKNGFYDFKIHYKGWEDSIILHNACITRLGIRSRGLDKIINRKKGFLQKNKNPMSLMRLTTHLGKVKTNLSNYYIPNKKQSRL